MVGSFKQIVAAEGAGALATGLGATAGGYFVQGWFKVRLKPHCRQGVVCCARARCAGSYFALFTRLRLLFTPRPMSAMPCYPQFGGVEFFKIKLATAFGEQKAWDNRTAIYLASAAGA